MTDSLQDAIDYLLDAAYIAGTLTSHSVFDHHDATDYLRWAADLYADALTTTDGGAA